MSDIPSSIRKHPLAERPGRGGLLRSGIGLGWALAAGLVLFGAAYGAMAAPVEGPVKVEAVEAELVARETAVVPGKPLELGLRLLHDPHWHSYWRNPGDSGLPTQLELKLPAGFVAGGFEWPAPYRLFIPPLANYGYENELVLPLKVQVPAAVEGDSLRVTGKASWLMCSDVCIPGEAELALTLPVSHNGSAQQSRHAPLFDEARSRLPDESLEVRVAADGDRLSIGLPEALRVAEFFPYREGLVANAAPQTLHALDVEGQPPRRLEVRLSQDGARRVADPAERAKAAEGVLVAGDRVFELKARPAEAPFASGVEISRVDGAPENAPATSAARGSGFGGLAGAFSRGPGNTSGAGGAFGAGGVASAAGAADGIADGAADGAGSPGAASRAGWAGADFGGSLAGLLIAALFAAIGGLILNLMPCVFPVIGLKVLGFARHGGTGDAAHALSASRASRASALAFSAGVIVSFWLLAALLLALRAAGESAGWGFQLQSPAFVAAMALLFVAIGLNFSGVWEFGAGMTRLGQYEHDRPASNRGSFGAGVLAVLVATPCTAPFMGSALGYTLSAGVVETLVVFTALGFGMAVPYLLLGTFPAWLRLLPRPGRWMESFRQALAFPMYATSAWLAWVLGQQAGIDAVLALAIGAVLIGFAAWLYGRFVQSAQAVRVDPAAARRRRALAASLAVLSLAAGLLVAWPGVEGGASAARNIGAGFDAVGAGPSQWNGAGASTDRTAALPGAMSDASDPAAWHPWSSEAVAGALADGRPVFVDFTAAWCVSCQVNKKLVLDRDPVVQAMQGAEVLRLRADWTSRDEAITAELARHGRNGVPLYLLYRPGSSQPLVLPELLTSGSVLSAIAALAQ